MPSTGPGYFLSNYAGFCSFKVHRWPRNLLYWCGLGACENSKHIFENKLLPILQNRFFLFVSHFYQPKTIEGFQLFIWPHQPNLQASLSPSTEMHGWKRRWGFRAVAWWSRTRKLDNSPTSLVPDRHWFTWKGPNLQAFNSSSFHWFVENGQHYP